jgi:hypothetical protein
MKTMRCFTSGLGRVLRSPSSILWLYAAMLVVALPLSIAMRDLLRDSIGSSLVNQNLRQSFDLDWYSQFRFSNSGIADTFGPSVVGILPVLANIDSLLSGSVLDTNSTVLLAGLLFLIAWAFFGGGIIARYSRSDEPFTRTIFFSNSSQFFFRFLRLLVISLLVYWAAFSWIISPLFRRITQSGRDITAEGTLMMYTALVYLLAAVILMASGLASDYAKISLVVDDRRSAVFAFLRGLKFAWRNPGRTIGLYLLLVATAVVLIGAFTMIAPGPNQWRRLLLIPAFAVGQFYVVCRIVLKLWFLASQTRLYQAIQAELKQAKAVAPPAAVPGATTSAPNV